MPFREEKGYGPPLSSGPPTPTPSLQVVSPWKYLCNPVSLGECMEAGVCAVYNTNATAYILYIWTYAVRIHTE